MTYEIYRLMVDAICDQYMNKYKEQYSDNQTDDTAQEFLNANYNDYRQEIARLGVNCMHEAGMGSEDSKKILQQNSWSIGKLAGQMMEMFFNK